MPTYIGFSTIDANKPKTTNRQVGNDGGFGGILKPISVGKKFKLVDEQLVIRDLLNALNIRQGQKVGQPEYGTKLWDFIFDPNSLETQTNVTNEIRRIAGLDPRILINSIRTFTNSHGILVEIEIAVSPFNQSKLLSVFFNSNTNQASIQL